MAVDHRIPLMVNSPDYGQNMLLAARQGQEIASQPYRNALLEARANQLEQAGDFDARRMAMMEEQRQRQQLAEQAMFAARGAEWLRGLDEGKREQGAQVLDSIGRQYGYMSDEDTFSDDDLSNDGLDASIATLSSGAFQNMGVDEARFNRAVKRYRDPNTPDEEKQALGVLLGLRAREGTLSRAERLSGSPSETQSAAEVEATIEGAVEGSKQQQRMKWGPQIAKSIKRAEAEGRRQGEAFTELRQMEAAMPGLEQSIEELKALASIATYTVGGRIWDAAVRESGFGSTDGADARAQFIAIVNNQVLPLLRQTFGAAFTEREGESLKRTMGDPNASPSEKMVQLETFIRQKQRNIEAARRETETEVPAAGQRTVDDLLEQYGN